MQLDLLTKQTGNRLISVYNDQWKLMWHSPSFVQNMCLDNPTINTFGRKKMK